MTYVLFLFVPCLAMAQPQEVTQQDIFQGQCRTKSGVGILVSPHMAVQKQLMRVFVVSEHLQPGAHLLGLGPKGEHQLTVLQRGGPPYWWFTEIVSPDAGIHKFVLIDSDKNKLACIRKKVHSVEPPRQKVDDFWPLVRSWDRNMENFYSAWIEKMFDAPQGERQSWKPLHEVTRDPNRNFFHNYLGYKEDESNSKHAVVLEPDCADMPFFLRAYFAWKMRLPFGYRHCDRGSSKRPTHCSELRTNQGWVLAKDKDVDQSAGEAFTQFIRKKVSYIHSASGRTDPIDDETDLYPVQLDRKTLRPGIVYVDPYGHLLVISRFFPQTKTASGLLYAVDGHPDLSIGRKRFWRGAFLFNEDIKGGAGGFKAFRPLVIRRGQIVALTNDEMKKAKSYRNYSLKQYHLGLEGFYDQMDQIINPEPLSPTRAYSERIKALYELIQERVDSVKAGEEYMRSTNYKIIEMPSGPRIFETQGPWEDFSTPARDIRLLIAIEDILRFPQKVVAHPQRFSFAQGQTPKQAQKEMESLFEKLTKENSITYIKSDGSSKQLTMAEIIRRSKGLEMAYNPNDCVEIRWGGDEQEMSTCTRHAPAKQLELMRQYRIWFATRNRPSIR